MAHNIEAPPKQPSSVEADVIKTQVQVYSEQIKAFVSRIQAESAKIDLYKNTVEAEAGMMDAYVRGSIAQAEDEHNRIKVLLESIAEINAGLAGSIYSAINVSASDSASINGSYSESTSYNGGDI